VNFITNELKNFISENTKLHPAIVSTNCDNLKFGTLAVAISVIAMTIFLNVGVILTLGISAITLGVVHDISIITSRVDNMAYLENVRRNKPYNDLKAGPGPDRLSFMTRNTFFAALIPKRADK